MERVMWRVGLRLRAVDKVMERVMWRVGLRVRAVDKVMERVIWRVGLRVRAVDKVMERVIWRVGLRVRAVDKVMERVIWRVGLRVRAVDKVMKRVIWRVGLRLHAVDKVMERVMWRVGLRLRAVDKVMERVIWRVGLRLRAVDKVMERVMWRVGLRVRAVDKGIFIQLVQVNSPSSLVGLRFGDQVLQIDGECCAGWSTDRAHKALKRAGQDRISMIVRDRPFQRTVTLQKDSSSHVGFIQKKGLITSLVKDSSAARNGLLTNHYLCEVNGQNVIGLKDRAISDILTSCGQSVTVTVIPSVIYEHIIKRMSSGLLKSSMDHSIPEV
ncbi:syntenin-2 isoform 2-T2 [Discoglossus pictus]